MQNALWMVEKLAGRTWKTGNISGDQVSPESLEALDAVADGNTPLSDDPAEAAVQKLQRLGFSEGAIYAMAQQEWQAWSSFLRGRGWTLGPRRNTAGKQHERLVDSWEAVLVDPTLKAWALRSLADTQIALAKLKRLGFSEDTAYAMAEAEWESWSRYLDENHWTLGDKRDEAKKKHEKLVASWEETVADPELKAAALKSLADAHGGFGPPHPGKRRMLRPAIGKYLMAAAPGQYTTTPSAPHIGKSRAGHGNA
jgi:hypothetical protein